MKESDNTTHFGFQIVPRETKEHKVREVFQSVASRYDVMNDLMSLGVHRVWKQLTVELARIKRGQSVLDLAGGSGDLTRLLRARVGDGGFVVLADINAAMLAVGRNRLLDEGLLQALAYAQVNAECLPFADNSFDCVTMGFGLRNVTDKLLALRSIYRVCKPGGKIVILEFSTLTMSLLQPFYHWYLMTVLPKLGQYIANDESSYRYLAESIRLHPDQETLKALILEAGFEDCHYHNFTAGIAAMHLAYKY